jgi:WD40 repeat protein
VLDPVTGEVSATKAILWEADTGKQVRVFGGLHERNGRVIYGVISPDGKFVVAARGDAVTVWNLVDGTQHVELPVHPDTRRPLAFSSDGKRLFVLDPNRRAVVAHDTKDWKPVCRLSGTEELGNLTISPDGLTLAAVSVESGTVFLWEIASANLIRILKVAAKAPDPTHRQVTFSADGTRLLYGSGDGTLVLWDTRTWEERSRFEKQGPIVSVALSPDGRYAFCGCSADVKRAFVMPVVDVDQRPVPPPPDTVPATFAGSTIVTGQSLIRAMVVSQDGKLAYTVGVTVHGGSRALASPVPILAA